MEINEKELPILPCPIMDIGNSIHYSIALELVKLGILRSFEGKPLSISKIRDKYVDKWDSYWSKEHGTPAESPTGPYWIGPRTSIIVANKIISFLNEYEVVIPIQPYSYVFDTYVVDGTACIVRKKSGSQKERNYFTVIFQEDVSGEVTPDAAVLTKWYYVESLYGSTLPSGVLFVPLLKGKIKQAFIKDIKLAKSWIVNALGSSRATFPIAGSHCIDCKSKKCREVLNVGQNEDPRIRWLRKVSTKR